MENTRDNPVKIERYIEGSLDADGLNSAIASAWRDVVSEHESRAIISSILGGEDAELDPDRPPFSATQEEAGFAGGEILIWALSGVAINLATGAVQKAGADIYDRLKKVWIDVLQEKVNPPGKGKLGERVDDQN